MTTENARPDGSNRRASSQVRGGSDCREDTSTDDDRQVFAFIRGDAVLRGQLRAANHALHAVGHGGAQLDTPTKRARHLRAVVRWAAGSVAAGWFPPPEPGDDMLAYWNAYENGPLPYDAPNVRTRTGPGFSPEQEQAFRNSYLDATRGALRVLRHSGAVRVRQLSLAIYDCREEIAAGGYRHAA